VVAHLDRIRRAMVPFFLGGMWRNSGGILFRISEQCDSFDVAGRLAAVLLGLGQ
jgi:hypothetical protein